MQNNHRRPLFLSHPRVPSGDSDTRSLLCAYTPAHTLDCICDRAPLLHSAMSPHRLIPWRPCSIARRSIGEHEPSVEHWILSRLGHVVCAVTFVHFARIRALVDKHLPDICDALECLSVSPTSEVAVNQTASMLMPSVLKMSRRSSALSGRCERMSALIAQTCSSSLVRQHLSARLHAKMLDIDSISPRFRLERCISGRT